MVDDVREVGFASPVDPGLPVEVIGYQALVDRVGADHFAVAQRPMFGLLLAVTGGSGCHTVDFDQIELVPGRLLFVRPGQVQQWHVEPSVAASVVLARPELCRTGRWFPGEASHCDLSDGSMATAVDLVAALDREQACFTADAVSVRLMGDLFSALVGLFERASPSGGDTALPDAYVAYRFAIEDGLGESRDARWFIADLGYSERTVTRACRRVTGLTAKGVLDERVVLEAKRLLAHTDIPVGRVGERLGFGEASNFNKFFARHSGDLPSVFRAGLRSRGYDAEPGA